MIHFYIYLGGFCFQSSFKLSEKYEPVGFRLWRRRGEMPICKWFPVRVWLLHTPVCPQTLICEYQLLISCWFKLTKPKYLFTFVLFQSCSLSFSLTNSSAEGSYVVQMIMEDFPRQTIVLTDASGVATTKTTSDFISKTPVQFLLKGFIFSLCCFTDAEIRKFNQGYVFKKSSVGLQV